MLVMLVCNKVKVNSFAHSSVFALWVGISFFTFIVLSFSVNCFSCLADMICLTPQRILVTCFKFFSGISATTVDNALVCEGMCTVAESCSYRCEFETLWFENQKLQKKFFSCRLLLYTSFRYTLSLMHLNQKMCIINERAADIHVSLQGFQ